MFNGGIIQDEGKWGPALYVVLRFACRDMWTRLCMIPASVLETIELELLIPFAVSNCYYIIDYYPADDPIGFL